MGGEKSANPKVTQEFYYKNIKHRWRRFVSPYPDVINIQERFNTTADKSIVYAFANLSVEKDTSIVALVGLDEILEIFLNGESVFKNNGSGKFNVDVEKFNLKIPAGKNNLLIKSATTNRDWKFSFRLEGSKVRNSKNRYKIIK